MGNRTLEMIKENQAKWLDLRFTDTLGKEQHVTIPASIVDDDFFSEGKMFDGSSIAGWKGINESDMLLSPDDSTAVVDPFTQDCTVNLRCNVLEPVTGEAYVRDPRSTAIRAEEYLKGTGIGDKAYFGPEPEFFVFDGVSWNVSMDCAFFEIHSEEGAWSSALESDEGNKGHRPGVKGGYFPVPPVDGMHDLRCEVCDTLERMGVAVEVHHHEVATAGQCEIGTRFDTLVKKADELQVLKYCVHNVADNLGHTATFMPKPLVGDNGNGMHCHQSIFSGDNNVFAGNEYGGLSRTALYYMGGVIKHARALNAFTNATTNSYKRLVPGFEAPVLLAYSARNRSAAIRIPYVPSPKGKRIEVRFPDSSGNPYLLFSALLMAGLDGIKNKIHPGDPAEKDLYDLPAEEMQNIPTVSNSLEQSIEALDKDREFLTEGGVFSNDLIDGYIELKNNEITQLRMHTHPIEFAMYYSV